jgi:hypothetical protein
MLQEAPAETTEGSWLSINGLVEILLLQIMQVFQVESKPSMLISCMSLTPKLLLETYKVYAQTNFYNEQVGNYVQANIKQI